MDMTKIVTGIQHIGVPTSDMKATVEFYEKIGFSVLWSTEDGSVKFLKLKECVIETYLSDECAMRDGAVDHIALNVSDIEAVFRYVNEGGLEVMDKKINYLPFFANGVRYFTIVGPNREKVEFNQKL